MIWLKTLKYVSGTIGDKNLKKQKSNANGMHSCTKYNIITTS